MSFEDEFDGPGSTSSIDWSDYEGRLLLIDAQSEEKDITTQYGTANAIRADVVVLDGPNSPEEIPDILIFPKILQSQVKSNVGAKKKNLGRLGKGEKKPGQSAPWKLSDPTDQDRSTAHNYVNTAAAPPF